MDTISASTQLAEMYRERQKNLLSTFNLEKGYDQLPQQELWKDSRESNVPQRYIV